MDRDIKVFDFWDGVFAYLSKYIFIPVGWIICVSGPFLLCGQTFYWLYSGAWKSYVLLDVIVNIMPLSLVNWLIEPESWQGLHKIIIFILEIPLFIGLTIIGFLVYRLAEMKWDDYEHYIKQQENKVNSAEEKAESEG